MTKIFNKTYDIMQILKESIEELLRFFLKKDIIRERNDLSVLMLNFVFRK